MWNWFGQNPEYLIFKSSQSLLSFLSDHETVVSNTNEAWGRNMGKKATDELNSIQSTGLLLAVIGIVFPRKLDHAIVERDKP